MDDGFGAINIAIGVIILVIVASILGGSTLLGAAVLGSFTGFVSLALIFPIVILGKMLYRAWKS